MAWGLPREATVGHEYYKGGMRKWGDLTRKCMNNTYACKYTYIYIV